jgi:hypothetical protein
MRFVLVNGRTPCPQSCCGTQLTYVAIRHPVARDKRRYWAVRDSRVNDRGPDELSTSRIPWPKYQGSAGDGFHSISNISRTSGTTHSAPITNSARSALHR